MTISAEDLENGLAHFNNGAEPIYKSPVIFQNEPIYYSNGVKYLKDKTSAHWLVEDIFLHTKFSPKLQKIDYFCAKLVVNDDRSAEIHFLDRRNKAIQKLAKIEYTDFPLKGISLWMEMVSMDDGIHKCLILPSEY